MKVCPKCGYVTADDSDEFCIKCGAYFTDPKAQRNEQSSAIGAAMGMTVPHERQEGVPVPDDGTFQAAYDDLSAGNYAEGVAQLISCARRDEGVSDEEYARMKDAMLSCIVSSLGDASTPNRTGTAELAMELDQDLVSDLMGGLASAAAGIDDPKRLARLSSEYMYLALESFQVYPDLRDVIELYSRVPADMDAMAGSPAYSDETAAKAIDVGRSFASMMSEFMSKEVASTGDEKMDRLSDYWSSKADLPYARIAYQIASLHAQISNAKNVGRLTSKLFKKGMDIQLDGFRKAYFSPRVRSHMKSVSLHFLTLSLLKTESIDISRISTRSLV